MLEKYSDIIKVRSAPMAYTIADEQPNDWKSFIANEEFNSLLDTVVRSVTKTDISWHKSFWVEGTYGTGKSHAGAVVKHLLCDPLEDIRDFLCNELYPGTKDETRRNRLLTLRKEKRWLAVNLYGNEDIAHENGLSLCIQRGIYKALNAEHIKLRGAPKTDFESLIEHVEESPSFYEDILKNEQIRAHVPSLESLKAALRRQDATVYEQLKLVFQKKRLSVATDAVKLSEWLEDMQALLEEQTDYNGFFIIWDEFTLLMQSEKGSAVLNLLQPIVEAMQASKFDSYFFLISHPSALDSLEDKKKETTLGRYNRIHYNMQEVSTFKIMSSKFIILDQTAHRKLYENFYKDKDDFLDQLAAGSSRPQETKEDIKHLYPLHPSTAKLATYYASIIGSSSRSVFEFLADTTVSDFLESVEAFSSHDTLTPDMLWDYIEGILFKEQERFGTVTSCYNKWCNYISQKGKVYSDVFKGVLLLNAFNNCARGAAVTPSTENIKKLFWGTPKYDRVEEVLNFLDAERIIMCSLGSEQLYSVEFSVYSSEDYEKIRSQVAAEYAHTYSIVQSSWANMKFSLMPVDVVRTQIVFEPFSSITNVQTLVASIERCMRAHAKPYSLKFAVLFSREQKERRILQDFAESNSQNPRLKDVIFIVPHETLGDDDYNKFIACKTNAKYALTTSQKDIASRQNDAADSILEKWAERISRGQVSYYVGDRKDDIRYKDLDQTINKKLSPFIFSSGPESIECMQIQVQNKFWLKSSRKTVARAILSESRYSNLIKSNAFRGEGARLMELFDDCIEEDMTLSLSCSHEHPVYKVCSFVDEMFAQVNKSESFNLGELLQGLSRPPFGLYSCYASIALLSFSLKKHMPNLYTQTSEQVSAEGMTDRIIKTFTFWDEVKSSPDPSLQFCFESAEARELCQTLNELFGLQKLDRKATESLKQACWVINGRYIPKKGAPLWVLKYLDIDDSLKKAIEDIVDLCNPSVKFDADKITSLNNDLKLYKLDLFNILISPDNYDIGFKNVIRSFIKNIEESSVPLAVEFLKTMGMQGDICSWSEQEVRERASDWYIDLIKNPDRLLSRSLVSIFSLKVNNPASFDEVCETIRGDFSNEIEAPLWALKYCDDLTTEQKDIIERVILVCSMYGKSRVNISSLQTSLKDNEEELRSIVTDRSLYIKGFHAFVKKSIQKYPQCSPEEITNRIIRELPGDYGSWTEREVSSYSQELARSMTSTEAMSIPSNRAQLLDYVKDMPDQRMRDYLNDIITNSDDLTLTLLIKYVPRS